MASTQMHIADTDFSDLQVKIRPGQTVYIPGEDLDEVIDAKNRRTYVYTANGDIQTVSFDQELAGGEVLPDFRLILGELF